MPHEPEHDGEAYVEAVLSRVELIPPGRATTYGALAAAVGRGGPRQVGRVLALYGGGTPWWRVVRADGSLPPSHQREAVSRYREEGTPLRGSLTDAASLRVDLSAARWQPPAVGDVWWNSPHVADLPPGPHGASTPGGAAPG